MTESFINRNVAYNFFAADIFVSLKYGLKTWGEWNKIKKTANPLDMRAEYLNEVIGKEKLSELTANIAFAGFTAPKILWVKNNEPDNFAKISKIMLPKDFINYKLTGVHSCDYSDASGMLLLDVKNKCWSEEMLNEIYTKIRNNCINKLK